MKTNTLVDLLRKIDISNIFISKCEYSRESVKDYEGPVRVAYSLKSDDATLDFKKETIEANQPLHFIIKQEIDRELQDQPLFELHVTYVLLFKRLDESDDYSETVVNEFRKSYIPKIIHPYFRQLVNETLSKVSLPCIHIPLYENL